MLDEQGGKNSSRQPIKNHLKRYSHLQIHLQGQCSPFECVHHYKRSSSDNEYTRPCWYRSRTIKDSMKQYQSTLLWLNIVSEDNSIYIIQLNCKLIDVFSRIVHIHIAIVNALYKSNFSSDALTNFHLICQINVFNLTHVQN